MEVVVLAGGLGKRLRSSVPGLPKCLAPVNEEPFIRHLLSYLVSNGADHIVLALGYLSDLVIEYLGDHFHGVPITYSVEKYPLGTGGAILMALTKVKGESALVLNGDTFLEIPFSQVAETFRKKDLPAIIVREVENVERYGEVKVFDGFVSKFSEKSSSGLGNINAGAYLLEKTHFEEYSGDEVFSFEEYLQNDVKIRPYKSITTNGRFIDIGTPEDFILAQTFFGSKNA